jgi:hypothetical protein
MSMELKITFDESQLAKLMKIPLLMRLGPAERILKAMAKPIVVRAKAIAPNSRTSGTRNKMSSESSPSQTISKWPGSGKNHIKMIYRKGEGGGYLVIGASDPLGNSLNFDSSSRGRKVFYWGKDSGKIKRVEPSQRFMQKAFDETKSAQISAGNAQLEKEMKELNLG